MDETTAPEATSTTSPAKADLLKRAIAAIIDGAIASVVGLIPAIGGLIGAAYILFRDGFDYEFMDGRSVGKKLMKLRPVRLDGQKMTLQDSARRNWPLMFGSLVSVLLVVPVIGWVLIPLVIVAAAIISIIELVLVLTNEEGRRWGDKMASTKVIEVDG